VQDALTQIADRSQVSNVAIDLRRKGQELVLTLRNGLGAWPSALLPHQSGGALALHERVHLLNARLQISNEPGGAQQIMVYLPLADLTKVPHVPQVWRST